MKRFSLVVLTLAALGLGAADARTAAAQPVGYRSAADLVEVQYRPYRGPTGRNAAPSGGRSSGRASVPRPGTRTGPVGTAATRARALFA